MVLPLGDVRCACVEEYNVASRITNAHKHVLATFGGMLSATEVACCAIAVVIFAMAVIVWWKRVREARRQAKARKHALAQGLLDDDQHPVQILAVDGAVKEDEYASASIALDRWQCALCACANPLHLTNCRFCESAQDLDVTESKLKVKRSQRFARCRKQWKRTLVNGSDGHKYLRWVAADVTTSTRISKKSFVLFCNRVTAGKRQRLTFTPLDAAESASVTCNLLNPPFDSRLLTKKNLENAAVCLSLEEKMAYFAKLASERSTMMGGGADDHVRLKVYRDNIVEDSVYLLTYSTPEELLGPLRVQFDNERVVEHEAVTREWLNMLALELFSEARGLFGATNKTDQRFWLHATGGNKNGSDTMRFYHATGRLMARALLDGELLPVSLNPVLLKYMVGMPVDVDDLEFVDAAVHRSLLRIAACQSDAELHQMQLDFTISTTPHGRVHALVPEGDAVRVTMTNKDMYIQLVAKYYLVDSIERPLFWLLCGFYELVPLEMLALVDAKELDVMLSGDAKIDVKDWRANTTVSENLTHAEQVDWFWDCIEAMNAMQQSRLLQYFTGSCRAPIGGFRALRSYDGEECAFSLCGVHMERDTDAYPRVSACYNSVVLPLYHSKVQMEMVLMVLADAPVTGFTMP